jgi:[ribosomal protein S5]-alanine N-acetyltransferase
MNIRMELKNGYSIGLIEPRDKPAMIEYLQEKEIYGATLRIPNPYTSRDADWWVDFVAKSSLELGRPYHFSVRSSDDRFIGGIGFHEQEPGQEHRAEIGYWLAKPFWGKGVMTDAVNRFCRYGFEELNLFRITATIFIHNDRSSRVAEKCGFVLEGIMKNHYQKDGKIFDGKLYAKTRPA